MKNGREKAVAYLRTSSAANVGSDKDSEKRQKLAIGAYAKRARIDIDADDWFYDPGVSGTDALEQRPGFNRLLDRIESNGVRLVLIEDVTRLARDLLTQELGILSLIKLGVRVVTAAGDDLTSTDDPMKKAMRQIAGAFAELEKARLVAKLRGARERKRATGAKVEGRKSYGERDAGLIAAACALNDGRSLSQIADGLATQGYKLTSGKTYARAAVRAMLLQAGEQLNSRAMKRTTARGKRILSAA